MNDWLNMINELIKDIIEELENILNNEYKELMSNNENKENIDTDTLTL